ncbi:MAG: hypothetical protein IT462_04615 [Planctomycetes bacterium]|nr:hypothetical protein [Planctomycetota bacterium]
MRTLTTALFLLLLTAAVLAGDFDFAAERAKANTWLAGEHADVGKDYAKAGLNVSARAQFERALSLVPEHADAMKGLGNKKVDGRWVSDKPLPKDDAAGAKAADADKIDKARDKFYGKAAERLRKLAENAEGAGLFTEANLTWSEVLYYVANDATALGKLGRKPDGKGGFAAPFINAGREHGRKVLSEASEGVEGALDPQGEGLGAKLYVHSGGAIIARATESAKRAARIHKVGAGASALAHELLGAELPLISERDPYTLTTLQKPEQYTAMVEKYTDLKGEEKALALKLMGEGQKSPWGYFVKEVYAETAEDMLANTTSLVVLQRFRAFGPRNDPWIETGFSYLVTARLLGTTLCVRYRLEEEAVTQARKASSPTIKFDTRTPEGQRAHVLGAVRLGKDIPLRVLASTELNDMKVGHAAKSLSLFEFFFDVHRDATLKWLAKKAVSKAAELEQCCEALGKTPEELDAEWRRWVLLSY